MNAEYIGKKIYMEIKDSVTCNDDIKIKSKENGKGKPVHTAKIGDDYNRDRKKYIYREEHFDRRNDKHKKFLQDKETGEIFRDEEGKLSEHQGHGDAIKKKTK